MKSEQLYELIGIDITSGDTQYAEQVFKRISGKWVEISEELKQQVSEVLTEHRS